MSRFLFGCIIFSFAPIQMMAVLFYIKLTQGKNNITDEMKKLNSAFFFLSCIFAIFLYFFGFYFAGYISFLDTWLV